MSVVGLLLFLFVVVPLGLTVLGWIVAAIVGLFGGGQR